MDDNKIAFVYFVVEGNENFGGYVSVNGGDYVRVYNGFAGAVPVGTCRMSLTDEDSFSRGSAKASILMNNFTKGLSRMGSPGLLSTVMEASAERDNEKIYQKINERTWDLEVELEDGDVLIAGVKSNNGKIVDDPTCDVVELNDELAAAIEADIGQRELDENKKYAVAFWLCVFLGMFSAHRFYLKMPYAWLYLITGQLFGIGWLIDFIMLLVKYIRYIKMKKAA